MANFPVLPLATQSPRRQAGDRYQLVHFCIFIPRLAAGANSPLRPAATVRQHGESAMALRGSESCERFRIFFRIFYLYPVTPGNLGCILGIENYH